MFELFGILIDVPTLSLLLIAAGWLVQLIYAFAKHDYSFTQGFLLLFVTGVIIQVVHGFSGFTLQAWILIATAVMPFIIFLKMK